MTCICMKHNERERERAKGHVISAYARVARNEPQRARGLTSFPMANIFCRNYMQHHFGSSIIVPVARIQSSLLP